MKLYTLLILFIGIGCLNIVTSQKYISFKGNYGTSDCSGDSFGSSFQFINGNCVDPVPGYSYLFKIENRTTVLATEYTSSSNCPPHESNPIQSFTVGCSEKPSFIFSEGGGEGSYSIVSFSNVPSYVPNSIVMEQYSDSSCETLSSVVSYPSGFEYMGNNFVNYQYKCVNGIAQSISCYDNSCSTEIISSVCNESNGNSTVFCS